MSTKYFRDGSLTRRQLVHRGLGATAGLSALGLLAACGSSSSDDGGGSSTTTTSTAHQTVVLMTYPGWIGAHEAAGFARANPNASVKQVQGSTGGIAATATQIHNNAGSYDLALAGIALAGRLRDADLLAPVDFDAIPNIKNVPDLIRKQFPFGVPTDYGKTGIGYRKDLMDEQPTGWKDLWELAPKYSGKIVFVNFDIHVLGAALKYLGYSANSENSDELEKAKQAVIDIKPHIRAFLDTDVTKPMLQGEAVMTVDYDYDIAAASRKNPNVEWVLPVEGTDAYLEGWVPIKGGKHPEAATKLMNFHLDPKNYADFINTVGGSYVMPSAARYINKAITSNPALAYDEEQLKTVEFNRILGPDATKQRVEIWNEIQSA